MFPGSTKVTTSNNSQGRSQKQGDIKFSSEKYVGEGYLLPTVKMSAMLFSELKLVTDILFYAAANCKATENLFVYDTNSWEED